MRELVKLDKGVGEGAAKKHVLIARVTPEEIASHQKAGWRAISVEAIRPESWKGGDGNPIAARALIEPTSIKWLKDHRVTDIPVVFVPEELASQQDELFNKATGADQKERASRKEGHKQSAQHARDKALFIVRCGIALVQNLVGNPLGIKHDRRDPLVVQQLTAAREAIPEFQEAMLPIAENLLNGNGQRLAELRGLPRIDDQSAHCIFQHCVLSMLYLHYLKSVFGMDITAEDAVNEFLAALFSNLGMLADGDITEQSHRYHSMRIWHMIREQKPELPAIVGDLIADHGHTWVSAQPYLYRIIMDDGRGELESERRQYGFAAMRVTDPRLPQLFSNEDEPQAHTRMETLSTKYAALALALTVAEQVANQSIQGARETDVLAGMAMRITEGGYALERASGENQCVFAMVLAAAASAHKVRPRGAVMLFGSGKVPGGNPIAVSLKHPDEPFAPYCLVITNNETKSILPQAQSVQALITHKPGSIRRASQLWLGLGWESERSTMWHTAGNTVVGFVDNPTYAEHCGEVEAQLPRILQALKG